MKIPIVVLLLLFFTFSDVSAHCPHMMGFKTEKPSGPSAPGKLPDDDEGWDFDDSSAPGLLPDPHFIQSTYIYRSSNVQENNFSNRVVAVLKNIRERLGKTARLTLENENIQCSSPTDHFRCQEFPLSGSWNYFIVEDEKNGAVTYTFDRKNNEKNDGVIEMALLDALSRHSPISLISFSSLEAEKEVGYIRALSTQELLSLGKPTKRQISLEKFSPIELNLIEPAILEVRTGSYLKSESDHLVKVETTTEFDDLLAKNQFVFILFWNYNRMVSFHTFNLWSKVAEKFQSIHRDIVLAHVPCHLNADFCHGLNSEDFQTVVAYKNGVNIGKTENIGDEDYYLSWIEIISNAPLIKIENDEQLSKAKKGEILNGSHRSAITIGLFPNSDDSSLQHFRIAAEKLAGRYFLAYYVDPKFANTGATLSTYRPSEKQKRVDYSETARFDPATIMEFITKSSLPTVFDISNGFSTDLLLRQKKPILISISDDDAHQNTHFLKLASRQEARKLYNFAKIITSHVSPSNQVFTVLGVDIAKPQLILLNKDRVYHISNDQPKCPDHLLRLLQKISEGEANIVLSTKSAHPLRHLQYERVNSIFGYEESIVLPDHTLFLDSDPFAKPHPTFSSNSAESGGCPFMQNGVGAGASVNNEFINHNEL